MRDPRAGIVVNGVTRNPFVWGALALCSALILAVTLTTPAADILKLVAPDSHTWLLILAMSAAPVVIGQVGILVASRLHEWRRGLPERYRLA